MSKINIRVPYHQLSSIHDYKSLDCSFEIVINLEDVDLFDVMYFKSLGLKDFTVHAPFFDVSLGSKNRDVADVSQNILKKVFSICNKIKPVNVVMHHNYQAYAYAFDEDSFVSRFYDQMSMLLLTKTADFNVLLENVFETTPDIGCKLINAINRSDVGFCFDVGHFNLFSDVTLFDWVQAWTSNIYEYHLHNNFGTYDDHNTILDGTVDIKELLCIFKPAVLTIENNNSIDSIQSFHSLITLLDK